MFMPNVHVRASGYEPTSTPRFRLPTLMELTLGLKPEYLVHVTMFCPVT
jgi:hypothetical protein